MIIERLQRLKLGESYELTVVSTDTAELPGTTVAEALALPPGPGAKQAAQELHNALRNIAAGECLLAVEERITRTYTGVLSDPFKSMSTRHALVFRQLGYGR